MKHTNVRITGVPERERGSAKSLFKKVIAKNFPNLGRDLYIQVHKDNESPHNLPAKQPSPRHMIMKLSKIKGKERI